MRGTRLVTLAALALTGAAAPTAAAEAPEGAGACVIRGRGEMQLRGAESRGDERPFHLFASAGRRQRIAEVAHADVVPVTWSRFPVAGQGAAARVHLVSDGLQLGGWATVRDRIFQLQERADVVPERLWARRSALVRIVGSRAPLLVVEVETSPLMMRAPQVLELSTTCGNLVYEPERLASEDDGAPGGNDRAEPTTGSLTLSRGPADPPFLRMLLPRDRPTFRGVETMGRWVRVAGDDSVLAFDAWVPAWQVDLVSGGAGRGGMRGRSRRLAPHREPHVGMARRDAVVSVGVSGPKLPIGVLLAGTRVRLEGETEGAVAVPFALAGRNVVPPTGQRFWLATADVDDLGVGVVFPEKPRD